jgi:hypothetical protein
VRRTAASSLAAFSGRSYLALVAWLAGAAGCRPAAPELAPDVASFGAVSAAAFWALAAPSQPAGSELLSLRWRFTEAGSSVSGRGAARVTPPDSLRIDVRGPLGFGRGALVLGGDSVWADPEDLVRQVLPGRFMVWAMLGVVRTPDEVERYEVGDADGRRLLRLVEPGGRATTFELGGDVVLGAVQSRGDTVVGRLTLVRGADGRVVRADAQDFERRARLVFDITGRTPSGGFPATVWRRP